MQIDSATPPSGFAQNDSIAEGFEITNENEGRIQSCTNGSNLLTWVYLSLRLKMFL